MLIFQNTFFISAGAVASQMDTISEIKQSMDYHTKIVVSIKQYYVDKWMYPSSLTDPEFLKFINTNIVPLEVLKKANYQQRENGAGYSLSAWKWEEKSLIKPESTTSIKPIVQAPVKTSSTLSKQVDKAIEKLLTSWKKQNIQEKEIAKRLQTLLSKILQKKSEWQSNNTLSEARKALVDLLVIRIEKDIQKYGDEVDLPWNDLDALISEDSRNSSASWSTWKIPKVVSNEKKWQIGKCYSVETKYFGSDESNYLLLLSDWMDTWSTSDKEKCASACRESIGKSTGYMCLIKWWDGTDLSPKFNVSLNLAMENQGQDEGNPTSIKSIWAVSNKTMHVIGVYEGKWYKEQWSQVTPGKVSVRVTKSIGVLVLSAYSKTEWTLDIPSWVTIEQIITNGYYNQIVIWNGTIPVKQISIENNNSTDWLGAPYSEKPECTIMTVGVYETLPLPGMPGYKEGAIAKKIGERDEKHCERDFYELSTKKNLKRLTSLDITSFQGTYTGESFEVK